MSFAPTYRQSRERIGRLNQKATFYTPVSERTATGGEKISWVEWTTIFTAIENNRASEDYAADRRTAFNTKRFTARKQSLDGVNEKMILAFAGEQYHIESIQPVNDQPVNSYLEITATRRDTTVSPVETLNGLFMGFAQKNASFTGTDWTITAGTMPDTEADTEADIHQRCYLFRSGLRQVYLTDFTIEAGNVIRFAQTVRGELILFHQYNTSA